MGLDKNNKKDVLVTGVRRSGTTFTGRMLSLPRDVGYVFEPFNPEQGIRGLATRWYPYLQDRKADKEKIRLFGRLLNRESLDFKVSLGDGKTDHYKYDVSRFELLKNIFTNFSRENFTKRLGRVLFRNKSNLSYLRTRFNPFVSRLLVKDPGASLSSEYLEKRFDLKVVALTRHPAAVYYSMKKLNWGMEPESFLSQEALMEDRMEDYTPRLQEVESRKEMALLEWLIINEALYDYVENNDRILLVRHEDLCLHPVEEFKELYEELDLPFDESIERRIRSQTSGEKVEGSGASDIKRDARQLAYSWRDKLSEGEIQKVRKETYDVSGEYYPEEEW